MRQELRWWVTASVVVLAVGGAIATAWHSKTASPGDGGNAAVDNLRNALPYVTSYYADNGHSFSGMLNLGSSTTSSVQQMESGLSWIANESSTGPHDISTRVGGDGSWVALAAFDVGDADCWGILDLPSSLSRTVLGISQAAGTYFFVIRTATRTVCNAARITAVSAFSTWTFPSP